ncbi:methyltransferase [uncultured Shewanella sp.]|uniref:methyltransferase n=1 Tax=uncultured Shewanella sp. TaxID=173975 RepID=UPI00263887FF|nr:methyltransferase [uncultured Shewanella sp.]
MLQHTGFQGHFFQQQLANLDRFLYDSRALWQVVAFQQDDLPWQDKFPTLAEKVWQLEDFTLEIIDKSPDLLLSTLLPALEQDCRLSDLQWDLSLLSQMLIPLKPATEMNQTWAAFADEAHFSAHIKGRKWHQITAFTQSISDTVFNNQYPVLEWCAGKGHLGRLIAKTQEVSVLSIEWQEDLCRAGEAFAQQWVLPQHFICADAFTEGRAYIKQQQCVIALHACGDLHVNLLQSAAEVQTKEIAFSPCCYHLIKDKTYQALSKQAQQSFLQLSRHDLQLPLQQSVIASGKQNDYRLQEIAWRLGFDTLQREVRGVNTYLPVPSIKQSQLNGTFNDFCLWAAKQKNVVLPDELNFEALLKKGYARQRLTRRIDLVAHLFRGVLERWLLLDRVCFLQEAGYQVHLSRFCDASITPRNALITASKSL